MLQGLRYRSVCPGCTAECISWQASGKRCFSSWVLCCLALTFLLHLFLQGGEGRELHRAPPIREPRCSSAPRLPLWVNKLYPEILSPPPPPRVSVSNQFFKTHFSFAFLCFLCHHPLANLFLFFYSSLSFFSSLHPPLPILPTEASKNKLSLCLPTALLLCKTAGATWRSLKVHVPKSATGAPQLCCAGSGSLQLFFGGAFHGPNWE